MSVIQQSTKNQYITITPCWETSNNRANAYSEAGIIPRLELPNASAGNTNTKVHSYRKLKATCKKRKKQQTVHAANRVWAHSNKL